MRLLVYNVGKYDWNNGISIGLLAHLQMYRIAGIHWLWRRPGAVVGGSLLCYSGRFTTVGYGFMMIFTLESSHSRLYSTKNVYFVMLDVR